MVDNTARVLTTTCLTFQKVRNVFKLGDFPQAKATFCLHDTQVLSVHGRGSAGKELKHLGVDGVPGGDLLLGVLYPGDLVTECVAEGDVSNHLPPGPVLLITPAGVRHVKLWLKLGQEVVTLVKLRHVPREPATWNCNSQVQVEVQEAEVV